MLKGGDLSERATLQLFCRQSKMKLLSRGTSRDRRSKTHLQVGLRWFLSIALVW